MLRGRRTILLLALWCLVTGACALRSGSSPAPGPDPRTAIALSVLGDSVYLMDPGTGRRTEAIRGLIDFQSGYATWAPDHVRLAVANDGISILDLHTGDQRVLVQGTDLSMPTWSPDGSELAYGDGISLFVTPSSDGTPARIRLPATLSPLDLAWGPNGDIAFEGLHRDCAIDYTCPSTDQSDLWVVSPDARRLRQLTSLGHVERPRWSPDGTELLFIRTDGREGGSRELWVVGRDGTGARPLLPATDVLAADWSPDGLHLALVRIGSRPSTMQLWVADADGGGARPVGGPIRGSAATLDW